MLNGRRRNGATLGLVAICVLVIIVIGVACFWLVKIMGGGRELANATDSGALNVAKYAIRNPSKDPVTDFPGNPDVATNFALLTDTNNKLNLLVYNRLVAQATLVALNAHDEATPDASESARKVWLALNTVGQALTKDLDSSQYMGNYYSQLATKNNVRMSGGNAIGLSDYQVSFLKKGGSTNIWIDPVVLGTISSGAIIPQNAGGAKSPSGKTYMAGYQPYTIRCDPYDLEFSGITVNPNDRPHLVSYADFFINRNDNFVSGKGNPAFPAQTIPPNGYQTSGNTKESKTNMLAGAVACAIASSMNVQYQIQVPYGYLEIINGPQVTPAPRPDRAATPTDIFSHALAGGGIDVSTGENWFCPGGISDWGDLKVLNPVDTLQTLKNSNGAGSLRGQVSAYASTHGYTTTYTTTSPGPPPTTVTNTAVNQTAVDEAMNDLGGLMQTYSSALNRNMDNLIDIWATINGFKSQLAKDFLWDNNIPDKVYSANNLWHHDGRPLAVPELRDIVEYKGFHCEWQDYKEGMDNKPCLEMLGAFRKGFQQPGTTNPGAGNPNGAGYTNLEEFKVNVMLARTGCQNCATATPSKVPTGVKWFQHGQSYGAPALYAYNFGIVKTPWDYLDMIDQVSAGCGKGQTTDAIVKRCQQIEPTLGVNDVKAALLSHSLALGQTLYLYCNDSRKLVLTDQKPASYVPGTAADGIKSATTVQCGTAYDPMGTLVNVSTGGTSMTSLADKGIDTDPAVDGSFPNWAWHDGPKAKCTDTATFTPSTGYNNFLGQLSFSNVCTGGGGFCRPN